MKAKEPLLGRAFAIPNQGLAGGAIYGARRKAEGVRAGVWDVFLPSVQVTAGKDGVQATGGLFIEMKTTKGRLSDEQTAFASMLGGEYVFAVARSWTEAARIILGYIGKPELENW